jgi:GNAT superfamily N-acetyltransferase
MPEVTVRPAAARDIDQLVASVAGLFREDAARHDALTDQGWPARDGAAYYRALLSDDAGLVLLAWQDGSVAGHLVGRLNGPSSVRTEAIAVLESMRVAPGARRAGVGSLLVESFLDWARERGAREASVTAFAANDTALAFYARHGFRPASVISRRTL